jgi:uncharacterized membrane protein YvbJ
VYCPNCGKKQKSEREGACPKCTLPLGGVVEVLEKNKAAIEEYERQARETRARLIGSALFVTMAAVPIGFGVKNTLAEPQPRALPGKPKSARG